VADTQNTGFSEMILGQNINGGVTMNNSYSSRALIVLLVTLVVFNVVQAQEKAPAAGSALLPLPESLRNDASVVAFDAGWNRRVLHQGTGKMACVAQAPFMGAQYAVCQHESAEAFWVMGMKLRAQGQTANEVDEARIEAMREGSLEVPQTGTARYFLIGGRLENLLPVMVISLPNATSASTGLPTEPDSFRPWLMHAGTPSAHIMLPGN
jgi:hypothetical protein